jgi:hypothetical protein
LKKLAEKVAVYVDECVSNGEVSLWRYFSLILWLIN